MNQHNPKLLQQILKEELSFHSIADPTLLKPKVNARDCTTITWQEPNKKTEIFLAVKKLGPFEGHGELDYAVGLNTSTRFYRQSRRILQTSESGSRAILQSSFVIVVNVGPNLWKTSNWKSQYSSSPHDLGFFPELGQVSVAWGKASSQPTVRCEQYTHKYSTYRVAHSIITCHHANTRGSRQGFQVFCVLKMIVIHVSCLTCPCLLPLLTFH